METEVWRLQETLRPVDFSTSSSFILYSEYYYTFGHDPDRFLVPCWWHFLPQMPKYLYLGGWGPRVICTSRLSKLVIPDKPLVIHLLLGFPGGAAVEGPAANAGNTGDASILGWGRSPGGGNGNSLQYSCLENPHGQRAAVHGVTKSWTWLSTSTTTGRIPSLPAGATSISPFAGGEPILEKVADVWELIELSAQSCCCCGGC